MTARVCDLPPHPDRLLRDVAAWLTANPFSPIAVGCGVQISRSETRKIERALWKWKIRERERKAEEKRAKQREKYNAERKSTRGGV